MIIRDDNTASQRGVSKAGFQKTGDFVEKDSLKRYQIVRRMANPCLELSTWIRHSI